MMTQVLFKSLISFPMALFNIPVFKIILFLCMTIMAFIFTFPEVSSAQEKQKLKGNNDCSIPEEFKNVRPDPMGVPTKIKIGFHVIDIKKISDENQSFTSDIFISMKWKDHRLSKESLGRSLDLCKINLTDLWFPGFIEINLIKSDLLLEEEAHVDDDGNITYNQRFFGELSSHFDFEKFPFDTQILHFIIVAYDYGPEDIIFLVDSGDLSIHEGLSIEGWEIQLLDPAISTFYYKKGDRYVPRIDLRFSAERNKRYYIWMVIVPLCFIVLMAWAVFWIDPSQIGAQIGLSTATIFTLIAYRFAIALQLPKVSYLTKLDYFILLLTAMVFLALGEAVVVSKIASDGNKKLANKIDKYSRVIYMIAFIVILLIMFVIPS